MNSNKKLKVGELDGQPLIANVSDTFIEEIEHNENKEEFSNCIKCRNRYEVSSWDFYSLCNECFREFDAQKMKGRFSILDKKEIKYFESAKEWVESLK